MLTFSSLTLRLIYTSETRWCGVDDVSTLHIVWVCFHGLILQSNSRVSVRKFVKGRAKREFEEFEGATYRVIVVCILAIKFQEGGMPLNETLCLDGDSSTACFLL